MMFADLNKCQDEIVLLLEINLFVSWWLDLVLVEFSFIDWLELD